MKISFIFVESEMWGWRTMGNNSICFSQS